MFVEVFIALVSIVCILLLGVRVGMRVLGKTQRERFIKLLQLKFERQQMLLLPVEPHASKSPTFEHNHNDRRFRVEFLLGPEAANIKTVHLKVVADLRDVIDDDRFSVTVEAVIDRYDPTGSGKNTRTYHTIASTSRAKINMGLGHLETVSFGADAAILFDLLDPGAARLIEELTSRSYPNDAIIKSMQIAARQVTVELCALPGSPGEYSIAVEVERVIALLDELAQALARFLARDERGFIESLLVRADAPAAWAATAHRLLWRELSPEHQRELAGRVNAVVLLCLLNHSLAMQAIDEASVVRIVALLASVQQMSDEVLSLPGLNLQIPVMEHLYAVALQRVSPSDFLQDFKDSPEALLIMTRRWVDRADLHDELVEVLRESSPSLSGELRTALLAALSYRAPAVFTPVIERFICDDASDENTEHARELFARFARDEPLVLSDVAVGRSLLKILGAVPGMHASFFAVLLGEHAPSEIIPELNALLEANAFSNGLAQSAARKALGRLVTRFKDSTQYGALTLSEERGGELTMSSSAGELTIADDAARDA